MENRVRRNSNRASTVPDPLVLSKSYASFHTALQTPPPLAAENNILDGRPHISKNCFQEAPTTCQMPYTPVTPRTPASTKSDLQSFTISQDAVQSSDSKREIRPDSLDPHTCQDLLHLRLGSPLTTKRPLSPESESESEPRPAKRVITEADLIGNPFLAMKRHGIPEQYSIRHMSRVTAKFFNKQEGASVHIRARSAVNSQRPRVNVIPRDNPNESFCLRFKSESAMDEEEVNDTGLPATTDQKVQNTGISPAAVNKPVEDCQDPSNSAISMPLHVEVAMLRAPLLGRLLLSGYIYRGDMLELELPHPDLLYDVMHWMYTGIMNMTREKDIMACVEFLNGR